MFTIFQGLSGNLGVNLLPPKLCAGLSRVNREGTRESEIGSRRGLGILLWTHPKLKRCVVLDRLVVMSEEGADNNKNAMKH